MNNLAADGYTFISGGAGFIGSNLAHRLLSGGERVVVYDNFSRAGVEQNYEWLKAVHGNRVTLAKGDVRDLEHLRREIRGATSVFHFAAQVAVTTSVEDPRMDFDVNAVGTLNVLEAVRARREAVPVIFTSTNKVYGCLSEVPLRTAARRYEPVDVRLRRSGVSEDQALDFYSPYGCSKGAADQYVLNHARIYGLPAVVFRMSCIYGPHQFGTEDQGWVAHFLMHALEGRSITLYGDGLQVRDLLYVDDLIRAFVLARQSARKLAGRAYNIGGGPANARSLLEVTREIEEIIGKPFAHDWGEWRPGDQRYYVTNYSRFQEATGWAPQVKVSEGLRSLHSWLHQSEARRTVEAA